MVVHDTAGLHGRVGGGGPDEAEAPRLERPGEGANEADGPLSAAWGSLADGESNHGSNLPRDPLDMVLLLPLEHDARERLGAAQPGMGVEAARRAVRLDPDNGQAQLALSRTTLHAHLEPSTSYVSSGSS